MLIPHDINIFVDVFPYGNRQLSQYLPNSILGYDNDYKSTLRDFDTKETLFYIDPPNISKKIIYYPELFLALKSLKGKFILIHDADKQIIKMGKGFVIERLSDEIIIKNYK